MFKPTYADEEQEGSFDLTKWTKVEHGSSKVTAAGKIVSGRKNPSGHMSWDEAFDIAGNWRSAHAYPLQVLSTTLRRRARKVSAQAIVAQRLKRIPSILSKLRRFNGMQLSQMQDLGGCRAVLPLVADVDKLVSAYRQILMQAQLCESYDYISKPKPDGYRGYHLIYSYSSNHKDRATYNGLKIEVQIRSNYQHAWATAVETIDTFTHQGLKSGIGDSSWKRFFVLVSSFIAVMESRPLVPGTPNATVQWFDELASLIKKLNVISILAGISTGLGIATDIPAASTYILILDLGKKTTEVLGFDSEELAAQEYVEIERSTLGSTSIQAVMVSVDSVEALRDAYPNYYLDTAKFLGILEGFLGAHTERQSKSAILEP